MNEFIVTVLTLAISSVGVFMVWQFAGVKPAIGMVLYVMGCELTEAVRRKYDD